MPLDSLAATRMGDEAEKLDARMTGLAATRRPRANGIAAGRGRVPSRE